MAKKFKRYLPIFIIFFIWFLYDSPFLLKGLVPYPASYQVTFFAPWSAYPEFAQPVRNNAMPDIIGQIYPWKKLVIDSWKSGSVPLWNPYSFSGTPLLANYQSAALSPLNVLFLIFPFITAWSLLILGQSLLAAISMFFFMRILKVSKIGSVIASIAFMFCGFITTWGSYGTLGYAIAILPLSLYFLEKYSNSGAFKYLIFFALTIPFSFFSGHFQTSIYFLIFIVLYIFYKSFILKNKKVLLHFVSFLSFGLLLAMPQILPSIELYSQSLRSTLFQSGEVIPWGYIPTFIAPDFFGNPVTRNDWFGHYAEWNAYIGFVPFMLALYSLKKKNIHIYFFIGFALAVLLLAFPSPVLDLMVKLHIPVLSTSAASRIIVLFSFCLCALAGYGFDVLVSDVEKRKKLPILLWLFGFLVILIILWGVILLKLFIPVDKIVIAKSNLQLPTLIFLSAASIVLSGVVIKKKKLTLLIGTVLALIVFLDLFRFSTKWQPFEEANLVFPQVAVIDYFAKITGYDRAFGNYGGEVSNYYKLPSVEGYDAVYIRRYGQFIASLSNGRLTESGRSVVNFPKDGIYTPPAVNLLGIKYIVHKLSDGRNVWAFPFWEYPEQYKRMFYDGKYEILVNNNVLPRAFFVKNYRVVKSDQEIIDSLFDTNTDFKNTAILEQDIRKKIGEDEGEVTIASYTPNKVTIHTQKNSPGLLFFSDVYYPGWKAFVDGKLVDIYQANFAFRSVLTPAGEHKVEFIYKPMSFMIGLYLAGIGLLGIISLGVLQKMNIALKRTSGS